MLRLALATTGSCNSKYMSYRTSAVLATETTTTPLISIPTGSLCGKTDSSVARFTAYGVPRVWL